MSGVVAYRARWIVPVDARPIQDGYLVVADGRVLSVTSRWPNACVDLGDVALIPGLVNCHTHLEFSALDAPLQPYKPFTSWIRSVIEYRQQHPHAVCAAIRQGVQESLASGVTMLGDIATTGWAWTDYASDQAQPRTLVFQELLGLTGSRLPSQKSLAKQDYTASCSEFLVGHGLSPHAPYSVHPELFQFAVQVAQQNQRPIAVHMAETSAEVELLREGTGEFREFLSSMGLWREEIFGRRSCRDWLESLAELPRALIIHGNYLSADELSVLAQNPQMSLIYCPRTHAAFGHPAHPWRDLIEMGGSVAIGTDSRASNPDLSLWKELQFLAARHTDVPHHTLLKLGTLHGARALGCVKSAGSLTPGKWADAAVISLPVDGLADATYELLQPQSRVIGTMLAGAWAWTDSELEARVAAV